MVTFSTEVSSHTVDVSSDVEWNVSKTGTAAWLSVEKQSDCVVLSVLENRTIISRETILLVEAGERKTEIKVKQDGLQPSFTSSKETVSFVWGGGSESVEVASNVDWEAKTHCDWLTITKTESGLSVETPENTTDKRRVANVDFYNSDCRFASILVYQESSIPQPAEYYSVDVAAVDWGVSYVHYFKDSEGNLVAVLTKENDGDKVGTFMYMASSGEADYSVRTVVTADAMFISNTDGRIYDYDPHDTFETVEALSDSPLVVVSDVKSHGAVKVGEQIWLAEDYKTTKYVDGTPIPSYKNGQSFWTAGDDVVAIHEGHYNYTGYTIGWNGSKCDFTNFAPEGWAVPTKDQYLELLGATGKNLEDMMNKSLFRATLNFKFTGGGGNVTVGSLGYTNTWTCTKSSSKLVMVGLKSDNSSVNSAQAVTGCFAVRLIKE